MNTPNLTGKRAGSTADRARFVSLAALLAAPIGVAGILLSTASPGLAQGERASPTPGSSPQVGPTAAPIPLSALRFRCVGPTRGGRVTAVAGVAQRRGVFYMGATGGGIWKTRDYGRSWRCVSDGFLASPSIGALRVAPSDPEVVWCGTGSDGIRSNVIVGSGVYRSTDAGKTWRFAGLPDSCHIGAIEVHPTRPESAFVAAIGNVFGASEARGLYRTTDGGETWERVLYVSDRCGAVDVEFHPTNPRTLYATTWRCVRKPWTIESGGEEGGVYKSRDGGDTWTKLETGLPRGTIGKADLAVTPADPSRVYVLIEAPGDAGGVYVSIDEGSSFVQTSSDRNVRKRPFYYTNIDACPKDADRIYVSATRFLESKDRGKSWRRRSTTHGDHHDLWIHPEDAELWIQGNDGGASVTLDGGRSWSSIENQPTAELYQVAVDSRFPYWLYAGQQDNTTIRVPSIPPFPSPGGPRGHWQSVGGCETGPAIPHPTDPDIVYSNCKGRFSVYDARTGQEARYDVGAANMYGHDPKELRYRFQRVSPIHVSPHDASIVYHCSQFVHRSKDGGRNWLRISPDLTAFDPATQGISGSPITRDITGEEFHSCVYSIRESTLEAGVIWVGANDGPVHVTRNGGKTWANVTPPALGPHGRVQTVEPSPHRAGKAYVCVLRYMLDDWRPHVYRTLDYGASWTLLSGARSGIAQSSPARVVREDPAREGLLYLGTEHGLYVSLDDGKTWLSLQQNLPVTPVTDLVVHDGDLVASTMGRSFWILDDLTPLRAWSEDVARDGLHLFRPRHAIRTRSRARRTVPVYPGPGARIDYYVGGDAKSKITLEIRDANGAVIRRFEQKGTAPRETLVVTQMETFSTMTPETVLPSGPGHRRFVWDLRHAGTGSLGKGRGSRSGPLVAPGRYRVVLADASRPSAAAQIAWLDVRADPRLEARGITTEDLLSLERAELRARDGLRRAAKLADELSTRIDEIEPGPARTALESKLAALVTRRDIEYAKPMLIDQWIYLAGVLGGGDRRPGQDALDRLEELESELRELARND